MNKYKIIATKIIFLTSIISGAIFAQDNANANIDQQKVQVKYEQLKKIALDNNNILSCVFYYNNCNNNLAEVNNSKIQEFKAKIVDSKNIIISDLDRSLMSNNVKLGASDNNPYRVLSKYIIRINDYLFANKNNNLSCSSILSKISNYRGVQRYINIIENNINNPKYKKLGECDE